MKKLTVAITGPRNSGKTFLIRKIAVLLKEYNVATGKIISSSADPATYTESIDIANFEVG